MPRDWNALAANSDGLYESSDFKHAMYQLVVQQCIYLRQRDQAVAYRLISAHRDAFAEAVALMRVVVMAWFPSLKIGLRIRRARFMSARLMKKSGIQRPSQTRMNTISTAQTQFQPQTKRLRVG